MSLNVTPSLSGWRVVSASVCGASHRARGQPCQDAHAWLVLADQTLVAAVADGAGSAEFGAAGAELAVRRVVEAVQEAAPTVWPDDEPAWRAFLLPVVDQARKALIDEAAARDRPPRELAATLILVIAAGNRIAAAQIGDGAAVMEDGGGSIRALSAPIFSEYLNETTFLVSPDALEKAQVSVVQARAARIALLSDGLQMLALKLPSGDPHEPFFRPLFDFAAGAANAEQAGAELSEWLSSPKVVAKTDDDLTLLLAAGAE